MTNEEAKTVLINCTTFIKDGFRFMKEEHQEQFKEAYRVAIQALEKQIPKKSINTYDAYKCPKCENEIISLLSVNINYCYNCGQALDWSEGGT